MKALLIGAGMALAAGMTMGFAMQPQLGIGDERPAGPQLFAAASGERSTGPFDPGTSFNYQGQLPDYVIGTDWRKAAAFAGEPASLRPDPEELKLARYEAPPAPAQAAPEREAPPASYPSLSGGEPYGADRPAAAEAPRADD